MASKIFLTGGTGYIGGSVLHTIVTAHPEYDVTVLLRKVPEAFSSTYPNVKIVKGDYDSAEILSEQASKADVIVHNGDSDHEPSLNAIINGLLKKPTPGFLLHLSGTAITSDFTEATHLGKINSKIWSDIKDLGEIQSRPDDAPHRNTEIILNNTVSKHGEKVNIAIICPPDIYGRGKGLAKTWSAFVPMFVKEVQGLGGRVFYHGEGTNTKSWVHIDDLMDLYLKVVEAAAAGGNGYDWNKEGYYFAGTQEHSQIAIAQAIGDILTKHNIISTAEPINLPLEKLDTLLAYLGWPKIARYLFASNSRTRPHRAEKLFGYKANAKDLMEELEEDVLAAVKME